MTTSELHIGHAYVIRDDRKGLCIALAVGTRDGQSLMCLREMIGSQGRWSRKPRQVLTDDIRRPATPREVSLALAL